MHTVVIGAGVIGLTTAYHLAREGESITLVDARRTGLGASEVNAGWWVPAEASPIPGPGVVSMALRNILRPDSPLYIRPSLHPDFLAFMYGMWRRSNARDQRAGFEGQLRLAEGTAEVLDQYAADGMEFEMRQAGLLLAYTGKVHLEHRLANLDLARRFGRDPQVLMGDAARSHEPLLSDAVYGGIYFPHERHLDPAALGRALHRRLVGMGVEIVEDAPIDRVERDETRVRFAASGSRRFPGDRFILAAGGWTGPLSQLFGTPLPIRAGKGYCVEMPPFGLRGPTNLADAQVAVTPFEARLRMSGTIEFGGLDERVNRVRVAAILRAPARYFRGWQASVAPPAGRAGILPMTPDGLPVIGRLGPLENAYVSSGHAMMGVTLAPGTALALADLVLRDRLPAVLEPFSPSRFARSAAAWPPAPWLPPH